MKESRLYLKFFKDNLLIILLPALLLGVVSLFYQLSKPEDYKATRLFEVIYNLENVSEKIALTDQAVAMTRSLNLTRALDVGDNTQVVVFKPSPLSIQIEARSVGEAESVEAVNKLSIFLSQNYHVKELGQAMVLKEDKSLSFPTLLGFFAGMLAGLIFSLIRAYFKNY